MEDSEGDNGSDSSTDAGSETEDIFGPWNPRREKGFKQADRCLFLCMFVL